MSDLKAVKYALVIKGSVSENAESMISILWTVIQLQQDGKAILSNSKACWE